MAVMKPLMSLLNFTPVSIGWLSLAAAFTGVAASLQILHGHESACALGSWIRNEAAATQTRIRKTKIDRYESTRILPFEAGENSRRPPPSQYIRRYKIFYSNAFQRLLMKIADENFLFLLQISGCTSPIPHSPLRH